MDTDEVTDLKAEITDLKAQVTQKDSEIAELRGRVDELTTTIEYGERENRDLQAANFRLEEALAAAAAPE